MSALQSQEAPDGATGGRKHGSGKVPREFLTEIALLLQALCLSASCRLPWRPGAHAGASQGPLRAIREPPGLTSGAHEGHSGHQNGPRVGHLNRAFEVLHFCWPLGLSRGPLGASSGLSRSPPGHPRAVLGGL